MLQCETSTISSLLFENNGDITENCTESITYLNFAWKRIPNEVVDNFGLPSVYHLNLSKGTITGYDEETSSLEPIFENVVVADLPDEVKRSAIFRIICSSSTLKEIQTPNYIYWPINSSFIEIYDRKTHCLVTADENIETQKLCIQKAVDTITHSTKLNFDYDDEDNAVFFGKDAFVAFLGLIATIATSTILALCYYVKNYS